MNLVECYIKEIHSEIIYVSNDKEFVRVEVTYNSYGHVTRTTTIFLKHEWETAKEKGYWLG